MENLYSKYKIIADYHTHTTYSHGKGSIEDNVKKAINKGLKTIAITDHGSKHFIFGVSEKNLLKQKEEINTILQKYPDFQLLFGVESNITGIDGGYDITTGFENNFDIILCGFHKPVWADKFTDYFLQQLFKINLQSNQRTDCKKHKSICQFNQVEAYRYHFSY